MIVFLFCGIVVVVYLWFTCVYFVCCFVWYSLCGFVLVVVRLLGCLLVLLVLFDVDSVLWLWLGSFVVFGCLIQLLLLA